MCRQEIEDLVKKNGMKLVSCSSERYLTWVKITIEYEGNRYQDLFNTESLKSDLENRLKVIKKYSI